MSRESGDRQTDKPTEHDQLRLDNNNIDWNLISDI